MADASRPAVADAPRPVLDAPSAVEFMRETLIKISEEEISTIAAALVERGDRLRPLLAADALAAADRDAWRTILRQVFATRRRWDTILDAVGVEELGAAAVELIHGDALLADRFTAFDERTAEVPPTVRRDLAGELLHLHDPSAHWLWSRWLWNPATRTGSLPLVLVEDYDLEGDSAGEIYLKVGAAVRAVVDAADELGFHRMRENPFSVDVYLAGVYGVYLYTVTRLRMTQEFNQVVPKLPELLRRILGVHHSES